MAQEVGDVYSGGTKAAGRQRGAYWALTVITLVYAMNVADRFVLSTFIGPIKAEFNLSDASVGFLTGVALALFYTTAGLPLGAMADRANRET